MTRGAAIIKVFLALHLLVPGLTLASGTVTGRITGQPDGRPLTGAHILIVENGHGTVSDQQGYYSLHISTPGKYRIRVSFLGYDRQEKVIKIAENQRVAADFVLYPEVIETKEVEITGNRTSQSEQSAPRRMSLITAATISETPGQNITAVLDYISGVNMSSTMGVFANSTVVSLRGLSGTDQGRTLVLIDNMPLNKSDEGTVNWNLINRENVEKIEVTKGPGSARYGSAAMGGVINIRTKRPQKTFGGSATLDYGTYNTFGFRYAMGGITGKKRPSKGFFYDLNGFYRQSDGYNSEIPEYLEPGDTFSVNNFLREASIGTILGYRFDDRNSVQAGCTFFNDKRGRGTEIYESDGAWERHGTWQASLNYHGGRGKLTWNAGFYTLNEHFQRLNEYMSEAEYNLYLVKSLRTDLGLTADADIVAGQYQQVSAGFEFRKGTVDGQDIYYTSTDLITNAGKMENYALFVQDDLHLLENRLQFILGLRLNWAVFRDGLFTIENPSYSIEYMVPFQDTLIPDHRWFQADPKLSLQFRFNAENRIYISIARGFRAPNLDDLCRTGKKRNGFKISNPALKPEVLDNYETGMDVMLFKKLHLAPSFYYSAGHDFMYYVSTGDSVNMGYKIAPVYQKQNISRVDILGAEVDLDFSPAKGLNIFANYTFAHSVIARFESSDTATAKDLTGKYLTDVPMHKATAGFTWKNRIVNLNVLWKFVGPRWINDENEPDPDLGISQFPAYSTLGLRVWHTFFSHLTVALNVDNLFDVRYIDDRLQQSPGRMITAEITATL